MSETLLPTPYEVEKVYSKPENYPDSCTRLSSAPIMTALANRAVRCHSGQLLDGGKGKTEHGRKLFNQILELAQKTGGPAILIGSTPRHLGDPTWDHDIDIQLHNIDTITNGLSPYTLNSNINLPNNRSLYALTDAYALLTRHQAENSDHIYSAAIIAMPNPGTDPTGRDHIVEFGTPPDNIPNASSDPSQKQVVVLDAEGGWLVDLTHMPATVPTWLEDKDLLKGLMWLRHLLQDPYKKDIQPIPHLRLFHEHMDSANEYAFQRYLMATLTKVSRFRPQNSNIRFTDLFSNPRVRSIFLEGLTPALIHLINFAPILDAPEERFALFHSLTKNIPAPYSDLHVGAETFVERVVILTNSTLDISKRADKIQIGARTSKAVSAIFNSLPCNLACSQNPEATPQIVLSNEYN